MCADSSALLIFEEIRYNSIEGCEACSAISVSSTRSSLTMSSNSILLHPSGALVTLELSAALHHVSSTFPPRHAQELAPAPPTPWFGASPPPERCGASRTGAAPRYDPTAKEFVLSTVRHTSLVSSQPKLRTRLYACSKRRQQKRPDAPIGLWPWHCTPTRTRARMQS